MIAWYYLLCAGIVGIGVGYGFRGLINRLGKKLLAPIYAQLGDVKTRLNVLYTSAETDVSKIKAEIAVIIAKVEKVLP